MTKAELIDNVAKKVDGLTRAQVDVLVSTVFGSVKDALAVGDKVEIRGFGSFRLRYRAAREGRNPKSGEVVKVPSKMVPFFKAGKELKEMVDR